MRRHHGREQVDQRRRARHPLVAVDLEELLDGLSQERRRVGRELEQGRALAGEDGAHHHHVVHADEGSTTRERFVHQHAEREEVDAAVDVGSRHLLGRHVGDLPLHDAGRGHHGGGADGLGDAEVGELHFAFDGEQHVARRDVAMDDALVLLTAAMRVLERVRELHADPGHQVGREAGAWLVLQQLAQVDAIDQLDGHVLRRPDAAVVDGPDDVHVPQPGGQFRLSLELLPERLVLVERGQHALEAHVLHDVRLALPPRDERLRHPAHPEPAFQDVFPERSGQFVGHRSAPSLASMTGCVGSSMRRFSGLPHLGAAALSGFRGWRRRRETAPGVLRPRGEWRSPRLGRQPGPPPVRGRRASRRGSGA